ncbi:Alpha-dioxygenase 2 [Seminavis robusta]|uniref:Alpha-dioxygenase 2 n=1 Tax=Seminavis robusta TaxID=568900 RepID=A0A9N8HXN8_9STRA|nr:Alpha-dioxygenase 2 [Seminavis robusta]|eukprot:Sro1841_g300960.1 Alpha-dioxygenase 2 (646) ;mRNA; f:4770-6707
MTFWTVLQSAGVLQAAHTFLRNYLPWHQWPEPWGVIPLALHRDLLEQYNLFPAPGVEPPALTAYVNQLKQFSSPYQGPPARPDNGFGTDVRIPAAGARGSPFGRNCPVMAKSQRLNDDLDPPVQLVAQKLLARRTADEFYPAGMQLNILAAAWIQSMVHDWVGHYDDTSDDGEVRLEEGSTHGCPLGSFSFRKTLERPYDDAYDSFRTHWWDASWLYGQSRAAVEHTRAFHGGRVRVSNLYPDTKFASRDHATGTYYNSTGDNMNSWIGVSLLQELFLKEHNAVADEIRANHPEIATDDDKVFGMARLVVSAVLAKIHTVDWTIELLKTRTMKVAMWTNWYGFPYALRGASATMPEFITSMMPDFLKKTGNDTMADDKGVPFSLTEEFTAVYRLHPLLPDQLIVHLDGDNDNNTLTIPMIELVGPAGERALRADPERPRQFWDAIMRYPCGNLQLHNFPHTLRNLHPTDELGRTIPHPIDLAAVDLYRDRERGILRFNNFRRSIKLPAYKDFFDLTGDETLAAELEEVYGVDGIERCDLQVCRFAEKKLPGFALSETSFTIFLVMATRRLEADPFLHQYYTEEHYSATGLEWVEGTTTLRDVLARHYPDLVQDIGEDQSVFTPRTPWPGQEVNTDDSGSSRRNLR